MASATFDSIVFDHPPTLALEPAGKAFVGGGCARTNIEARLVPVLLKYEHVNTPEAGLWNIKRRVLNYGNGGGTGRRDSNPTQSCGVTKLSRLVVVVAWPQVPATIPAVTGWSSALNRAIWARLVSLPRSISCLGFSHQLQLSALLSQHGQFGFGFLGNAEGLVDLELTNTGGSVGRHGCGWA